MRTYITPPRLDISLFIFPNHAERVTLKTTHPNEGKQHQTTVLLSQAVWLHFLLRFHTLGWASQHGISRGYACILDLRGRHSSWGRVSNRLKGVAVKQIQFLYSKMCNMLPYTVVSEGKELSTWLVSVGFLPSLTLFQLDVFLRRGRWWLFY